MSIRPGRRRSLLAFAVVIALAAPFAGSVATVSATPSASDLESARAAFNEGLALRDKGDLDGALKKLSAAWSLASTPIIGLELGRTHMQRKELVEAADVLATVARLDAKGESPNAKKARAEAAQLEVEVRTRIPSLRITVIGAPAGATPTVTVDGAEVPWAAIGEARKLDPGKHVVEVRVDSLAGRLEVDLAEKDDRSATITLASTRPAVGAAKETPSTSTSTSTGEGDAVSRRSSTTSPLVYVGLGLAGVGLVAGSITGIMTLSKSSKVKDGCPDGHCPPAAVDDLHAARTTGTISTISFAVAGAGVVLGVIGLLSGTSSSQRNDARVSPFVSLGGAGVEGAF